MSVIYDGQYVDEKYVNIIEPNLYYDSVLVPGVTYTDKYETQAGGIFIHKLGTAGSIAPGTPGRDFTDEVVADTLIQAVFNNNFQRSRKIWGVTEAAVSYNKAEAELAEALSEVKEGWQLSGLAALVNEGTQLTDFTAITDENVKDYHIDLRKGLKKNKANPDFAMYSSDVFASFLKAVGSEFVPVKNDSIVTSANAGMYFGTMVIEANGLAETSVKYYDYTGTLKTIDLSEVDMIMGDHMANSVLNNFITFGINSPGARFSGVLAQVEFNTAYRVTNVDRIAIKFNSSPTA